MLASRCVEFEPAITAGLDDEFSGSTLAARWTVRSAATFERRVASGWLHLKPTQNVVWWKANQGPALVQRVKGNFRVTTRVRARKATSPANPPDSGYQFGGLIARDPASDKRGKESYVFAVVGFRGKYLAVETKTTRDDSSYVDGPKWPSGDAELRICRVDTRFYIYRRPVGGKLWELVVRYQRPDLGEILQVGPIAYAFNGESVRTSHALPKGGIVASFDYVRFAPSRSKADCTVE